MVLMASKPTNTVTLSTADRIGVAGLFMGVLGGAVVFGLSHDRDITMLKTDNAALKSALAEVQGDVKALRSDMAEVKALLSRQAMAQWPDMYADMRVEWGR